MLNNVMIVGRISDEIIKDEEKNIYKIILGVPRYYKNEDGEYETDYIDCILKDNIDKTSEYLKKGTLVGIKGRLEQIQIEPKNDLTSYRSIKVIAERITFLKSENSN